MKVYNFGNDYANEKRQKSKESKVAEPAPVVNEPQNKEVDDKNQIPTGGGSEMEGSPEKDETQSPKSEPETNQETETQEKKKGRPKKQDQETD